MSLLVPEYRALRNDIIATRLLRGVPIMRFSRNVAIHNFLAHSFFRNYEVHFVILFIAKEIRKNES
jgi:hypothetical protein